MAERTFPLDCPMCHGTGNDQGGLPMCRICAARQQSEQVGYVTAFYELAALMGLPARATSPETVWREQMLPRLSAALAAPAVVVSAEPVEWRNWIVTALSELDAFDLPDDNNHLAAAVSALRHALATPVGPDAVDARELSEPADLIAAALSDDGAALRLAVKFGIEVRKPSRSRSVGRVVQAWYPPDGNPRRSACAHVSVQVRGDSLAATRMAIVRAAEAIGAALASTPSKGAA